MENIVSTGYLSSTPRGKFFFTRPGGPIARMQTVQDTRRQRVGMLKKMHGTWAALNLAIGWDKTSTRLSQIHSGTLRSDRGTPYTMGDETAREIEKALGLEQGWMDTPPSYAELSGNPNDPISKALDLLQAMEPEARYQALRLLNALAEPSAANGTTGH